MIHNIEHLFKCLLALCMSSLEKCLFRPFPNFLIGIFFGVGLYKFFNNLCIIGRYVLLFCGLSFILLIVSFAVQKLFNLIQSYLFIFSFVSLAQGDISEKILLWEMPKILLPVFF